MSDISELFARDPLKLSDQATDQIIARMRESLAQQELGIKPKAEKPTKPKATKLLDALGLSNPKDDIKDLGL